MTGSEQEKTSEETAVSDSTNVSDQGLGTHLDPFMVNTELDPDTLFEQWAKEDERNALMQRQRASERFTVGRHPLILGAIFIVSAVLSVFCYPALDAVIHEGEFEDCGDVLNRAINRSKGIEPTPFYHQQSCQLSGMVGTTNLFAIGYQENPEAVDEFERNRGISYVVKMNGDQIYAILPAHPPEVEGYRLRNGSLFGLELREVGLMIDPNIATSYSHLERELRVNLGVKREEKLWFFDVSYSPWDHKMPLATALIAPLIALLSLVAIRRSVLQRRALDKAEKIDNEWLSAFEAAAAQAGLEEAQDNDQENEEG